MVTVWRSSSNPRLSAAVIGGSSSDDQNPHRLSGILRLESEIPLKTLSADFQLWPRRCFSPTPLTLYSFQALKLTSKIVKNIPLTVRLSLFTYSRSDLRSVWPNR